MDIKKCPRCKLEKKVVDFYPSSITKDRLNPWCKSCVKDDGRKRYKKNPNQKNIKSKEWRLKHKERMKELQDNWRKKNPTWRSDKIKADPELYRKKNKDVRIRQRFGITAKQYDNILSSQGGRCAICSEEISGKNAHLDHCHKTGKMRSFLCAGCNCGLGNFKDSPERLQLAKEYLIRQQNNARK